MILAINIEIDECLSVDIVGENRDDELRKSRVFHNCVLNGTCIGSVLTLHIMLSTERVLMANTWRNE